MSNAVEKAVAFLATTQITNVAVTATTNSSGVDVTDYEGLLEVSFAIPLVSGTSPTLNVVVETSDVSGSGYVAATKVDGTAASVLAIVAATALTKMILDCNALKKFVRITYTAGGTTPSFAVNANIRGAKRVI